MLKLNLIKSKLLLVLLGLNLILLFQNCGETNNRGFFGSGSNCNSVLCVQNGQGDASALNIAISKSPIIPISSLSGPYSLKLNGTCNAAGFVRNKIVGTLEILYTGTSKCINGSFTLEIAVPGPLVNNQLFNLELQLVGIDNFDNEYITTAAHRSVAARALTSIKFPKLSSLAGGNTIENWRNYRPFTASNTQIQIGDLAGFCDYSSTYATNNQLLVSLKAEGVADNNRLYLPNLNLVCQNIDTVPGTSIWTNARAQGYTGYYDLSNVIRINYTSTPSWDPSSALGAISSRNVILTISQNDPSIGSDFKIDYEVRVVLKFGSYDTAQGWTIEMLKQAMKQVRRAVTLNWDDSAVTDADLGGIFAQGSSLGFRNWLLNQYEVVEDPGLGYKIFSNSSFNLFYDRIGKLSIGTKRCDPRFEQDLTGGLQGSVSNVDLTSDTRGEERVALCLWYWLQHGVLDQNSVDSNTGWKSNALSLAVKEGVFYPSDVNNCRTVTTSTPLSSYYCNSLYQYFTEVSGFKNKYLGSNPIFGGNGVKYVLYQAQFYEAVTQNYINHIMSAVSIGVDGVSDNTFFDNVIKNAYNQTLLYEGLNLEADKAQVRRNLYPREINFTGTNPIPNPFSVYTQKNDYGSINAKGSETAVAVFTGQ